MPKKRQKGITLVALVITIIVLLILAGVTINVAIRTGLMSKSENAVDKYLDQERVEADRLDAIEKRMGELSGMKDNTEGTEHTKMIEGKDYSYKNPVIPAGFRTSSDGASWSVRNEEEVSGWNDGLVIEDDEGNQFVWVPVDGTNVKYERWCITNISYEDCQEQPVPSGVTSEQDQIDKYHGFYIARYEAGTELEYVSRDTVATPISKKNSNPWNNISWTNAKDSAGRMYTGSEVKSGLVTGAMWDTTMKWLKNSGVEVETDCREWGNYRNSLVTEITKYSEDYGQNWSDASSVTKNTSTSWLLQTGHTNYTRRKNIYDLAGNLWEWTNEKSSTKFVIRGGYYNGDGMNRTVSSRASHSENVDYDVGFRVGLYIM